MKKVLIFAIGVMLLFLITKLPDASEMDKGSTMDKSSTMVEGSAMEKETMVADQPVVPQEVVEETIPESTPSAIKESDSSEWGVAQSARAMIKGTQPESKISGSVDFVETGDGLQIVASLSQVTPPGNHGIHIHENGSCDNGGKSAGGHFNPDGTAHGLLPRDGHGKAHSGDMGNIKIDEQGNGTLIVFLSGLSLVEGLKNITGKAVILHDKEDDFGQPTGNAGGRSGCGIIKLNN